MATSRLKRIGTIMTRYVKSCNLKYVNLDDRKQCSDQMLKALSDVILQLEVDYAVLKDNVKRIEHLNRELRKCSQQATNAFIQNMKALKEIHAAYKKESEELAKALEAETRNVANELEEDINKQLQQKLVEKVKLSSWKALYKTISEAMRRDDF